MRFLFLENRIWLHDVKADSKVLLGDSKGTLSLAFSPDGRFLVSGNLEGITVFDLTRHTAPITLFSHRDHVSCVTISPGIPETLLFSQSGDQLAVIGRDHTVEIWKWGMAQLVMRLPAVPLSSMEGVPCLYLYGGLGFHARDRFFVRLIASPTGVQEHVEIWDLKILQKHVIQSPHKGGITSVALAHDGQILATAAWDGKIKLWELESGIKLAEFTGELSAFRCLAFFPDKSRLAAGGGDGHITLWDLKLRQPVAQWQAHRHSCNWLLFDDGDQSLLSLGDVSGSGSHWQGEIRRWQAPSLQDIADQDRAVLARDKGQRWTR